MKNIMWKMPVVLFMLGSFLLSSGLILTLDSERLMLAVKFALVGIVMVIIAVMPLLLRVLPLLFALIRKPK